MKNILIDFLYYVLVIAALVIIARLLTSCAVTTYPDGSRTVSPDYGVWAEITRLVISENVPLNATPVSDK